MVEKTTPLSFDHYRISLEPYGGDALPYALGRLFERYCWHIRQAVLLTEGAWDEPARSAELHCEQLESAEKVHHHLTELLRHSGLHSRLELIDELDELHGCVGFDGEDRFGELEWHFQEVYRNCGHPLEFDSVLHDLGADVEREDKAINTILNWGCNWPLQEFGLFLEHRLEPQGPIGPPLRKLYLLGRLVEQGVCPPCFWRQRWRDDECGHDNSMKENLGTGGGDNCSDDRLVGDVAPASYKPREPFIARRYLFTDCIGPEQAAPDRNWLRSVSANLCYVLPEEVELLNKFSALQRMRRARRLCLKARHLELVEQIDIAVRKQFGTKVKHRKALVQEGLREIPHEPTASKLCIADNEIYVSRKGFQKLHFAGGYKYLEMLVMLFENGRTYTSLESIVYEIFGQMADVAECKDNIYQEIKRLRARLSRLELTVTAKRNLPRDLQRKWGGVNGYVLVDVETVAGRSQH